MNNSKYLKKIFTNGNSSSLVVETFAKNWECGWIEHIRLPVTAKTIHFKAAAVCGVNVCITLIALIGSVPEAEIGCV